MEYSEIVFDYDKRGNVIKKSNGSEISSFSYNVANRIASATNSKGVTAKYTYNGLGFRVSKISENNSFDYILDQTMMYNNLLEAESKAETKDYVWCGDTLISESGELVHTDYIGTPIRIGDNTFSYDEFGVPVFGEGNVGFTGYMQDEVSGMHFAQAREYMPEMGRFAGRDVLKGNVERPYLLNDYEYCHNNPITFVDNDGMSEKKIEKYLHAGGYGAVSSTTEKYALNKIESQITSGAFRKKVIANSRYSRVTKHVVKNNMAIDNVANKKIVGSKIVGGTLGVGIDVAQGYAQDRAAGIASSKIASNAGVNAGYALVGIGVSSVATPALASGLVTIGVASGPAGWIALAVVGAAWGLWRAFSSDTVKNCLNSLD